MLIIFHIALPKKEYIFSIIDTNIDIEPLAKLIKLSYRLYFYSLS